ncbi:phage tail assembly chaperone [Pseudomonas sp. B14(2017)]|uniref:phage tail assembly chaperone n=1 Tax=Pseudomonas sp. B14(2017) TaxID=1981745 RepID=UPI0021143A82|nr:phage tail assembly chaperone [Pseudomonas sp. B14(2017)]
MNMWALVVNGAVREIAQIDPAGRFHESLVWAPCPEAVQVGWSFDGEKFAPPAMLATDRIAAERAWRDGEISSSEWLVNRHRDELDMQRATTITAEQFAELLVYRQALRDWPQTEAFPDMQQRPEPPNWIDQYTQ